MLRERSSCSFLFPRFCSGANTWALIPDYKNWPHKRRHHFCEGSRGVEDGVREGGGVAALLSRHILLFIWQLTFPSRAPFSLVQQRHWIKSQGLQTVPAKKTNKQKKQAPCLKPWRKNTQTMQFDCTCEYISTDKWNWWSMLFAQLHLWLNKYCMSS